MNDSATQLADGDAMRHADREWLSLALMQSRNQTLAWLALFERHADAPAPQPAAAFEPALWLAGHAAWRQERWIARNVQRGRGAAADAWRAPLASIEPKADAWWSADALADRARWSAAPPPFDTTRAYLAERRRLGLVAAKPAAHAARCRTTAPRRAAAPLRPPAARAGPGAGVDGGLVRGRCLVPLGRAL